MHTTQGSNWIKLNTLVIVLTICWTPKGISGQVVATPGQRGCLNNSVSLISLYDTCPREYLRCEDGVWRRAMCAGGIIETDTGICVPHNENCPGVDVKSYTHSSRRQVSDDPNCLKSYPCPNDITSIFIYPDWENRNCDSFIVCAVGSLIVSTCKRDNYNYYNPRRLSCEEYDSPTNICLHREKTDLSPAFP